MNIDEPIYIHTFNYDKYGNRFLEKIEVSAAEKMDSMEAEVYFSENKEWAATYLIEVIRYNIIHIHRKHCR